MSLGKRVGLLVAVAAVAVACGEDPRPSTPPEILNLIWTPKSAPLAEQIDVTGTFYLYDRDEDTQKLGVEIVAPDGQVTGLEGELHLVLGRDEAQVEFKVGFRPKGVGVHEVSLWVEDRAGQKSNRLQGEIEVTAP